MKKTTPSKKVSKSPPSNGSSNEEIKRLRDLSESVGDFIRYWGFRRIHGQIWTQVFLSKDSLSGAELTKRLGVSKALISPALAELEDYGLIQMMEDGKKTKRYSAAPDVIPVIKDILKKRESVIIAESKVRFEKLNQAHLKNGDADSLVTQSRLDELGQMITLAEFALDFLIGQGEKETLATWTEEATKAHKE